MRILYGVTSEGMGHCIRSTVVIRHLQAQGHEVYCFASGRVLEQLQSNGIRGIPIHTLHLKSHNGKLDLAKTVAWNWAHAITSAPTHLKCFCEGVQHEKFDAVITDFEPWSHIYGKIHRLPILSVDNIQILSRTGVPASILPGRNRAVFQATKGIVKAKVPLCDLYLVTSFFFPIITKKNTELHHPILRESFFTEKPVDKGYLLVYQTYPGNERLIRALKQSGLPCKLYGEIQAGEGWKHGNIEALPFSRERFFTDLLQAKAVIANGGFTLLSECLQLKKPVLSLPIYNQVEQMVNAKYLEHLGYGQVRKILDRKGIESFLSSLEKIQERLEAYQRPQNNEAILNRIESWVTTVA